MGAIVRKSGFGWFLGGRVRLVQLFDNCGFYPRRYTSAQDVADRLAGQALACLKCEHRPVPPAQHCLDVFAMPTRKHLTPPAAKSDIPDRSPISRIGQTKRDESFKERLRTAMAGREQRWLAAATGYSTSTINDYFSGVMPNAIRAFALARALGVDAEWLITGEQNRTVTLKLPAAASLCMRLRLRDVKSGVSEEAWSILRTKSIFHTVLPPPGYEKWGEFVVLTPANNFPNIAKRGDTLFCIYPDAIFPGGYYLVRYGDQLRVRLAVQRRDRLIMLECAEDPNPIEVPPVYSDGIAPPFIIARVMATKHEILQPHSPGAEALDND